jgi:lysozyme
LEYVRGVDLSRYQVILNHDNTIKAGIYFGKLKAAGVRFAYVRATTIDGGVDFAFNHIWQGLKAVGILRGAYGFANQNDPLGYAARMHKKVQATGELGELPPALDFECRYIAKTKSYIGKMTWQAAHDWLLHTESLFGVRPIVYTSYSMWFNPAPPWTNDYDLWVASYSAVNNAPKWMPQGWSSWLLWQQGTPAIGKKLGVQSEEIDYDVFNGDENLFREWAGLEPAEPTLEQRIVDLERRVTNLEGK